MAVKKNGIDMHVMSRITRKSILGVPTMSETNQAVQPLKMGRCLIFWI